MSPLRRSLLLALVVALAAAGTAFAAAAVITPTRVDGVHLGDTHADLRARGKVGPIGPGCELGGPNTRSAKLKAPLKGSVNYTLPQPAQGRQHHASPAGRRRAAWASARRSPQIKAKFPHAKVDHSTDQVFQLTLVRTPKRPQRRGRITFGVSTQTHKTTIIGVPFIAFCE